MQKVSLIKHYILARVLSAFTRDNETVHPLKINGLKKFEM